MFHVKQIEQCYLDLVDFLLQENCSTNLTGLKTKEDCLQKHILDSLSIAALTASLADLSSIIDIGTGAGFPGLIFAKQFKGSSVALLDSSHKKIAFVNKAIAFLELSNTVAFAERAEDHALTYRNHYSVVSTRAVARLDILFEYAAPLLKHNGHLIAAKSKAVDDELKLALPELNKYGFEYVETKHYLLEDQTRFLMFFKKTRNAQIQLPRKAGTAEKEAKRRHG